MNFEIGIDMKNGNYFYYFITTLIKYLLFTRAQSHSTIDSIFEDDRIPKTKQTIKFIKEVEELFYQLKKAFNKEIIYRMIISFGNNSLSPNEIYSLYFPDQINNYEDNFEIDVDKARKYSSKLLRQMLKHSIEFPLPSLCLTKMIIIIESKVAVEFEGFLPKRKFCPENFKTKNIRHIHFKIIDNENNNNNNSESDQIEIIEITDSEEIDESENEKRMWYQSTVIVHGIPTQLT